MIPQSGVNQEDGAEHPGGGPTDVIDASWLRQTALACGADDVGFVQIEREGLRTELEGIRSLLPDARSVVAIVTRANQDALRSSWMGVVNREASYANKRVDDAASELSRRLLAENIRSVPAHAAFPMDMNRWPGKMWPISHKIVAQEAGLGKMGHHRILIHPKLGSSVLLSTLVLARSVSEYGSPVEKSLCDGCKLCVAACPTGAIAPDGRFSLINCATHNYRYRMGGFSDWVEAVVKSRDPLEYRRKVKDSETVSMWQALAYGTNYTCLNCLAVCPAGQKNQVDAKSEVSASNRKDLVRKLRERVGPVYVLKGSDAEAYAAKNFSPDLVRRVGGGTRPATASGFLGALPLVFQPGRAEGLDAVYHFDFTGAEPCQGTVVIKDKTLAVSAGLNGKPSLSVSADGPTWVAFLRGETGLLRALITRKIRIKGSPALLKAFSACFPG